MGQRMAVVGAGAIGSTNGASLARAGHDETLIDQWPEHEEAVRRQGLKVTGPWGDFTVPVRALHLCDVSAAAEPFDVVFLAVKSYDTVWAAHFILPYLSPSGFVVSAQNSINDERIAPIVGYTRDVACILTLGAGVYEPGHVVRTGDPSQVAVTLGELHGGITPRLRELGAVMEAVGKVKLTTNPWGERWAKLATTCMANPMAGLTGLGSADVRRNPQTRRLCIRIAAETVRVAQALGVQVEPISGIPAQAYVDAMEGRALEEVETELVARAGSLGEGRPSLLQDVMKGRRTEVDYLNGYVARRGREVGVATPVCEAITGLIKRVERGELRPDVANVAYLERYV